jgi:hypothetical protein
MCQLAKKVDSTVEFPLPMTPHDIYVGYTYDLCQKWTLVGNFRDQGRRLGKLAIIHTIHDQMSLMYKR